MYYKKYAKINCADLSSAVDWQRLGQKKGRMRTYRERPTGNPIWQRLYPAFRVEENTLRTDKKTTAPCLTRQGAVVYRREWHAAHACHYGDRMFRVSRLRRSVRPAENVRSFLVPDCWRKKLNSAAASRKDSPECSSMVCISAAF